jgi:hypothetical protein
MRTFWDQFSIEWCRAFHSKISNPVRGCYHCLTCQRAYPVPWFEGEKFAMQEMLKERSRHTGFALLASQKSGS